MGRNCVSRYVQATPAIKGFRPFGRLRDRRGYVILNLDEYEAIRLLDYEHHTQEEAAVKMGVSRPTLTRIYERARMTFATALVEGRELLIGGGEIRLGRHLYLCEDCGAQLESADQYLKFCPGCASQRLVSLDECYRSRCGKCGICKPGNRQRRRFINHNNPQGG